MGSHKKKATQTETDTTQAGIPMVRSIEVLPVDSLTPTENNPRLNAQAVEEVARSIAAYGFNQPIAIYGPENTIKAGHTRWKAAKMLQMTEVPCVRLTHIEAEKLDEKARERKLAGYLIADNKTGELAGWDEVLLKEILVESVGVDLDTLEAMAPTGFSSAELDMLVKGFNYDLTLPKAGVKKAVLDLTKVTLVVPSVEIRTQLLIDLRKWITQLAYAQEIRIHAHED